MSNKTRYYKTLEDDFFENKSTSLPRGYRWIRKDLLSSVLSVLIYTAALIFSSVYCRMVLHIRFKGAKKLRRQKGGFFIYANHTQPLGDVFTPALAAFPKRIYTVVSPANLHLPIIGKILPFLGALPIPDSTKGMKEFLSAIEHRIKKGHPIIIYPEAHVWEYYTGIRPYGATSFKFPPKLEVPAFCMTSTYRKSKIFKKPVTTVYVDGPFFADDDKRAAESLKNEIFDCMTRRSEQSNFSYIKYKKDCD